MREMNVRGQLVSVNVKRNLNCEENTVKAMGDVVRENWAQARDTRDQEERSDEF